MKKIILGMVVMFLLLMGGNVLAEEIESWIGKTIEGQFPVSIDGERIEQPGLVIEGVSYIPVRAAGELFGYEVSFVDSEILLERSSGAIKEGVDVDMSELTGMSDQDLRQKHAHNLNSIDAIQDRITLTDDSNPGVTGLERGIEKLKSENAEIERILSGRGVDLNQQPGSEYSHFTTEQLQSSINRLETSISIKEKAIVDLENQEIVNESAIQSFQESIDEEKEELESKRAELERRQQ